MIEVDKETMMLVAPILVLACCYITTNFIFMLVEKACERKDKKKGKRGF